MSVGLVELTASGYMMTIGKNDLISIKYTVVQSNIKTQGIISKN